MMKKTDQDDPHLLYSIENLQVTAGTQILAKTSNVSKFAPLAADKAMTILMDMDITAVASSGNGSKPLLFRIWDSPINKEGLAISKQNAGSSTFSTLWMGIRYGMSDVSTGVGRKRFAVTHEANSDAVIVSVRVGTNTRKNVTFTRTFTAAPANWLYVGGSGAEGLPEGTINSFKYYDRILSADEINAFFAQEV